MNKKCLIVDDEPHACSLIEQYIAATPGLEVYMTLHDSQSAYELLKSNENGVDIVFLEIEMPGISGLELADKVKNKIVVIFTNGHAAFAADAYRKNAVDFLLKPVRYEHFIEAINKANSVLERNAKFQTHIFTKETMGGKLVKIVFDQILYIESFGNYAKVFLMDARFHLIHLSLSKFIRSLPRGKFTRIHKSYIVNIDQVESIDGNMLSLPNGKSLQVGASYRKDFLDSIAKHMI